MNIWRQKDPILCMKQFQVVCMKQVLRCSDGNGTKNGAMPQPSMTCQKIPIAGRLDLWYNANDIEVSSRQSVGIAGKEDALAGVFFHARNGRLALGEPKC